MRKKFITILLLLAVVFIGCNSTKNIDASLLKNSWTHAYEEDENGVSVFRQTDSQEFAPSMYRLNLFLKDQNQAEYLVLSPVDAHYMETGLWRYDTNSNRLIVTDTSGKTVRQYQVLEVTDNLLKVKEISSQQ